MKIYILIVLVVVGVPLVLSKGDLPVGSSSAVSDLQRMWGFGEYKGCGGVLPITMSDWTYLNYKQDQSLDLHEFCVWTLVAHQNIGSVKLNIRQNFQDSGNGITAYFWNSTTGLTDIRIPGKATTISFSSPPVFLTLSTHLGEPKGIWMEIVSFPKPGNEPKTAQDRAFHLETYQLQFSYPDRNNKHLQMAESVKRVFVVIQTEATAVQQMKKVTLRDVVLEPGSDSVEICQLWPYFSPRPGFMFLERFSENQTVEFATDNHTPTVMIFNYKTSMAGKGFTVGIDDYLHKLLP